MRVLSFKRWAIVCAFIFVAWSLLSPTAFGKVITWDYSPNAPGTKGSAYFTYTHGPIADIIHKDTNGRLKLIVHEALVRGPKVIDAVRDGTVDMGCQIVLFRAEMALLNFVALPFIPREKLPEMRAALRPIFRKQMSEVHDAILLGYGYWAKQRLIAKKPIRNLQDLKGYKIRVHNPELLGMLKAAGANPIFLPMAEAYPALQRGVVEGAVSSLEGIVGNKFYEVCKYVTDFPMGNGSYIWTANKKSWAAIPKDLQQTILKLFEDKYEMATFDGGLVDDQTQTKMLQEKHGVKFVKAASGDKKTYMANAPVILDAWKKRAGPRAKDVMAIVNKALGTNY